MPQLEKTRMCLIMCTHRAVLLLISAVPHRVTSEQTVPFAQPRTRTRSASAGESEHASRTPTPMTALKHHG